MCMFKNTLLCILYAKNSEMFISIFCENKSRPELNCNGKCKFVKMPREQNDNDAVTMSKQVQIEFMYTNPVLSFIAIITRFSLNISVNKFNFYTDLYSFLYTSMLFRPPNYLVNAI